MTNDTLKLSRMSSKVMKNYKTRHIINTYAVLELVKCHGQLCITQFSVHSKSGRVTFLRQGNNFKDTGKYFQVEKVTGKMFITVTSLTKNPHIEKCKKTENVLRGQIL